MSHQCSCGRDLNNNYVSYTNAYANANTGLDRDTNSAMSDAIPFWLLLIWSLHPLFCFSQATENIELPEPFQPYESRESRHLEEEDQPPETRSMRPSLMDVALQISARQGLNAMTELYTKIEPDMIKRGHLLDSNHPATLLSQFSAPLIDGTKPNPEMAAFAVLSATKAFRKNYKYINDLARQAHSPKISLRRTALESLCPPRDPPTCMPASQRYRTHDGTCNNERRPRWGSTQMPYNRFLPPVYGDGVDSIRNSVEGGVLSSSRFVSLLVHGARDGEAPLTLMIVQWGQLLDHDMTATVQPRSINGSVPSCCGVNDSHPSCFPIKVPMDDPWLSPLKVRCLEFLRSAPAQRRDCVLSWREQTNQATSYIDASPIYSNNAKSSDNARIFRNGLLVYGRGKATEDVCQRGGIAKQCIRAGDGRSGEQPGLLAMHHVWVTEHNRIAMELAEINQHWSDEKIYQEARRIVGAMFQHITYREFLPLVLGKEVCKLFELDLLPSGYYESYDPKVNPTVANSFAAAAFRFGHSLVQNFYMRCDSDHNPIGANISLHEEFQHGDIGSPGSLHRLIRGMATQRALRRDEFITPELTNHLFQTAGFPFGLDLAAINIQRGRDHGLPAYTSWRSPCGLSQINNWDDFAKVVGPESAQRIRHAYRSVHDIDLFVGGIAERPVIGGLVGPTFACIIAQQFSNSRKGDRFWYENGNFENSFTPAQLHALRRVSLAQVLCRTLGEGTLQPHIFIPPGFEGNERLPCGEGPLGPIDLTAWREQDPFSGPVAESPLPPQTTFAAQNVDRVFDIVSSEQSLSPHTTVHIIKEEKPGFLNRERPVEHKTSVISTNVPQVDFAPNSNRPFKQRNITNINDKLDFKRKGTINRKPIQIQEIAGINNKLDKNDRHKHKGFHRNRIQATTKRTVIINNVPIELRNAESTTVKAKVMNITAVTASLASKRPKHKKRKPRPESKNSPEPRVNESNDKQLAFDEDDTIVFHGDEASSFNEFHDEEEQNLTFETNIEKLNLFEENNESFAENNIDPLKRAESFHDIKRIPRDKGIASSNLSTTTKNLTKIITLIADQPLTDTTVKVNPITKPTVSMIFPFLGENSTTMTPIESRATTTTHASAELRHYHTRPSYTRPHRVVLKGPNANDYEIEINIKQTSSAMQPQPITTNYAEYTNADLYNAYSTLYDRYTATYMNYLGSTPSYSYYQQQQPVTAIPYTQEKRTKPPTIIYLNENDRDDRTTRQPSVFQNFLSYATQGIKPHLPDNGALSYQKERPSNYLSSSPYSSSQVVQQQGSQSNYPISAASYSHSDGLHASSGAISTGTFGSAVAVASANGGESAFNFNIRPKPSSINSYEPKPSKEPIKLQYLKPEYINGPIATQSHSPESQLELQEYGGPNSPFSTHKSPSIQSDYYSRTKLKKDTEKDYDYLSRMLEPLSNVTRAVEDTDDYEYADDDDDDNVPSAKKFDRDGYLRPQYMIGNLFRTTNEVQNVNSTLDDNFVLPILNESGIAITEFPKPMLPLTNLLLNVSSGITNLSDTEAKNLNNEILADENEFIESPMEAFTAPEKSTLMKRPSSSVAFAPLTILTKPERPDNWVFYETTDNKPLLPDPPEIVADPAYISEIPKPFKDRAGIWLEKLPRAHNDDGDSTARVSKKKTNQSS